MKKLTLLIFITLAVSCKDEINKNNYFLYKGGTFYIKNVTLLTINYPPPTDYWQVYRLYFFTGSLSYDSTTISSYNGYGSVVKIEINSRSPDLVGEYHGFADIFDQGTFRARLKLLCNESGCQQEYYYYEDCWAQPPECVSPKLSIIKSGDNYTITATFFIDDQVTELNFEGPIIDGGKEKW